MFDFKKEKEVQKKTEFETKRALAEANAANLEAKVARECADKAKAEEKKEQDRLENTQTRRSNLVAEIIVMRTDRDTALGEQTKETKILNDIKDERKLEKENLTELQEYLVDLEQAKTDETAVFNKAMRTNKARMSEVEADLDKTKSNLKIAIKRSDAKVMEYDEQIADLVTIIEDRTKDAEGLEKKITKLESHISNLSTELEGIKTAITDAQKALNVVEDATKVAEDNKNEADAEYRASAGKIKELIDGKFELAEGRKALDERESIIREHFQSAGVPFPVI